jgi:hypothetical protein
MIRRRAIGDTGRFAREIHGGEVADFSRGLA